MTPQDDGTHGLVRLVLFDMNETLSDMAPLRSRFKEIGLPGHLAATWFAGVLRDGIALTAAGGWASFGDVADDVLRGLLAGRRGWQGDPDRAVRAVLDAVNDLDVHPDVPDAIRGLHAAGLRLATLTNGSRTTGERLLARAGVLPHFEALLDVDEPRAWKPARAAYHWAAERLEVEPARILLVAVHPWDIDGAARAGMRTAWVNRGGGPYPRTMTAPDHTVSDLRELVTGPAAGGTTTGSRGK
ncbi:haloacid dehalogenase type II [Actinacidiphila acididurans]|uniref:Haloacid dehalogenase type II n=1 Tax=Actinacidiphila acididurans TaxID=2784346 RepID=A0ABS2TLW7_9ACTN|nr:haloacid dehalogenase type II [Actinacidiphila acididurans]MBM9504334.1 haloacid dehalogenase type II [Actinacidiphila acididurans]